MFLKAEPARTGNHARDQNRLADQPLEGRLVGLVALEVGLHGIVVHFDGGFDHLSTRFLGALKHVGRNVRVVVLGAELLVFPHHRSHADEVDDALEVRLGTDRQLQRDRTGAEAGLDVAQALVEVRAGLVHLVAEDDPGNVILVAPGAKTVSV